MSSNLEECLLDGYKLDELGELDPFRKIIHNSVVKVVSQGKWFAFCTKAHDDQVDIMSIRNNEGVKMGRLIGDIYYPDTEYRSAVYKHFLRCYMCYYEVPITKRSGDTQKFTNGFDKFIATSNVAVIAAWLDITVEEAIERYAAYLDDAYFDYGEDEIPYVKLYCTKDGVRKIRKPRAQLDLSKTGTRVIPVFALKLGIDMLSSRWSKGVVRVHYLKDAGDSRELDVSTCASLIRDVYGQSDYLYKSTESMYEGDFLKSTTVPYGYLRVPEIGGSRYDNPLRSLSFARIYKVEFGVEPNLMFIDIDMDSILDSFKESIRFNSKAVLVAGELEEFGLMSSQDRSKISSILELETWVDMKSLELGTTFLRNICLFMLANPVDFPDYTGKPKEYSSNGESNGTFGLEDDDDDLI